MEKGCGGLSPLMEEGKGGVQAGRWEGTEGGEDVAGGPDPLARHHLGGQGAFLVIGGG